MRAIPERFCVEIIPSRIDAASSLPHVSAVREPGEDRQ